MTPGSEMQRSPVIACIDVLVASMLQTRTASLRLPASVGEGASMAVATVHQRLNVLGDPPDLL
jgi:hypothetical protein